METVESNKEIRKLTNGDWYWVSKDIIRHYGPRIGARGVAVYNLLAASADRRQTCYPSQRWMAERLGCSRATVNKAIKILVGAELVRIERRDRYHLIYSLLQVRCQTRETQMSKKGNSGVSRIDTNKKILTRINNNKEMLNNFESDFRPLRGFDPVTREELLASDLAQGLNDFKSLPLYLECAQKYSEGVLRRALSEVRAIPDSKIKKSRKALFKYLIQKYAQGNA